MIKKIQLACLSLLCATGINYAGTPCNDFKIKLSNHLSHNLVIQKINFIGGEISPRGLERLESGSDRTFILNNTSDTMYAEFILGSLLSEEKVHIKFELKNKITCRHNDQTGNKSGGYAISHDKDLREVTYTIG